MDELTTLALRAGHGDEPALEALVRATQADVWPLCAHLAGTAEADDLTQDTYHRALRGLDRFRATR
jgi:RNA polymerase sigma-70 factor (ECF subfamily)